MKALFKLKTISLIIVGLLFIAGISFVGLNWYKNYQFQKSEEEKFQRAEIAYQKCLDRIKSYGPLLDLSAFKKGDILSGEKDNNISDNKYYDEWLKAGKPNYNSKIENNYLAFAKWTIEIYPDFCNEYDVELINYFVEEKTRMVFGMSELPELSPLPQSQKKEEEKDKQLSELEKLKKEVEALKNQQNQIPKDYNKPENTTSSASIPELAGYIVRVICADSDRVNPTFNIGSGTIFGLKKTVITNSHIVEGMVLCSIGLTDEIKNPPSRWYEATIVQDIPALDIALLEPTQPLPENVNTVAYNLCNSNNINLGDSVIVLGYPTVGGNTITVTEGVVSGFDGFLVKTSAKIEHGSSGGGAFLKNENCWFGIPTSVAQGELESLGFIINYSLIHQKSSQ